jgi:UDP-N-acetylmuramate: L-alanyl-gamma-D-glutamyl-meso-diaminopimelate ligase
LDWDASAALSEMGSKALVAGNIDSLVQEVMAQVQAGDHLLCMSNGGFGGVHDKLLKALDLKSS